MLCPSCGEQTRVMETRAAEAGRALRRRRACAACERRFTTFERIEESRLFVRKRNGERQAFDRRKLREALLAATHKRHVSARQVEGIVDRVVGAIEAAGGELASPQVGELCLEDLRRLDWGAYLQFAGTLPDPNPDFADSTVPGSVRLGGEHSELPPNAPTRRRSDG